LKPTRDKSSGKDMGNGYFCSTGLCLSQRGPEGTCSREDKRQMDKEAVGSESRAMVASTAIHR
jgi:hypothetical protein